MSLGIEFHPEADVEFGADIFWYEDREPTLGRRFRMQVSAAIDAIAESPTSWAVLPGWDREPSVRSKGVNDFPYRVVYFVTGDVVQIVAVAHSKRRPGYWRDRVSEA